MAPTNDEVQKKLPHSSFLAGSIVEWWVHDIASPVERLFIKWKIRPNHITTAGLIVTLLASLVLASGHLIWGGWLIILAGCFDFWDGRVARALNLRSDVGAFYDSCLDRYMDAATFFALLYLFRDSYFAVVVALAFVGAVTTPYIRAKAESLGLQSSGGQMQRPERIVYVGFGGFLSGYMECLSYPFLEKGETLPPYFMMIAISLMAFMTNKVAIDRMIGAMRELRIRDHQRR